MLGVTLEHVVEQPLIPVCHARNTERAPVILDIEESIEEISYRDEDKDQFVLSFRTSSK